MSILSRLYVHPVKSMRGLQLSHALAGAEGLAFDRVFMLTDADGTFITARQYPQMLLFTPVVLPGGLHLTAPDGQSRHVRFADFSATARPVNVWGNHFTAYPAPETINTWLSGYLEAGYPLLDGRTQPPQGKTLPYHPALIRRRVSLFTDKRSVLFGFTAPLPRRGYSDPVSAQSGGDRDRSICGG